jgi:hypothetical protein
MKTGKVQVHLRIKRLPITLSTTKKEESDKKKKN